MLGLAPASGVAAETFLDVAKPREIQAGAATSSERIAAALDVLAAKIRSEAVLVECMDVNCHLGANEIVKHTISLDFIYPSET